MKTIVLFISFLIFLNINSGIIKFEKLCSPLQEKRIEAQKVNELFIYDNRLYIGYGDATINTGPTDIMYYDLKDNTVHTQFSVDDEEISVFRMYEKTLFVPGIDATEDWELGNIYMMEGDTWKKKRTIPNGIHVFDILMHQGILYCATGTFFNYGENEGIAPGAILSSQDMGDSWVFEYVTPSDKNLVYRVRTLVEYKDDIIGFIYGYSGLEKKDVPVKYLEFMGKPYVEDSVEYYLTLEPDIMGSSDCIGFNGNVWKPMDIIPQEDICSVTPAVFNDKLLLFTTSGRYISGLSSYVNRTGKLPEHVSTDLYVYDGQKTGKVNFNYQLLKDICIKEDRIILLLKIDGKNSIAASLDMISWKICTIPEEVGNPLSIEFWNDMFYIGNDRGDIYYSMIKY